LHEGQDVFCNYGEPVLATQDGTIQYDSGGLGGNIARLFRPDGTYWYYAHLTGWNDKQFPSGSQVHTGDVIGYCGNSGDAAGGPTHVHFGWYQPNGVKAMNPLSHLLTWLHEAQRNALGLVGTAQTKRIKELPSITVERRFGDSLVPFSFETSSQAGDVSTDTPNATVGVFGLTQTALQAALSETTIAQTSSAAAGLQASQAYTEKITTSQSSSVHQREENGGD
jgi:hypothetical protein